MNCGIVTFHKAHNYGAVLQAYALQKKIKDLGGVVSFVDYQHEEIEKIYRLYPVFKENDFISYIKRWIHTGLDFKRKYNRYNRFNSFIEKNLSCNNLDGRKEFDCVVLGSDQIWNPEYTKGFVDTHFGIHPNLHYKKLISYAASMGKDCLSPDELVQFEGKISSIDTLGVREKSLKDLILKINKDRDVTVNLDPTLLLDKSDWDDISETEKTEEPYILVYEVKPNDLTQDVVDYISKLLKIKVVVLSARTNFKLPKSNITDASPGKFLSLFKNANFVITTSFHGTVFSVINNKPFITVGFGDDTDIRSKGLLSNIGLKDRIIFNYSSLKDVELEIDYTEPNLNLSRLRDSSICYLESSLLKGVK